MAKGELNPMWVRFGAVMRVKREAAGLTQKELAEKVDKHEVQISRIENGESGTRRDTVIKIAKAARWNIVEALGLVGWKPTDDELKKAGYVNVAQIALVKQPNEITDAELANFVSRVKKLRPEQKRDFRIYWEMAGDYLERIENQ